MGHAVLGGVNMKKLLTTTAVLEAATGLALLAFPSLVTSLILGAPLVAAVALAVARVAGVALLALGVACWLARHDEDTHAARGLVGAMLLHNAGIVAVLVYGAIGLGVSGIALWPTSFVHAAMGAWCIRCLAARRA
jgi:hypothetical protein